MIVEEKTSVLEGGTSPIADLVLPFEARQKSRFLAVLSNGEEVSLFMPRGTILRGGEWLKAKDGRIVRVLAAHERIMEVRCKDAQTLARTAYHLGNRHVHLQVGDGWLRLEHDHVLKEMLLGLGASIEEIEAPFEPEAGAYGGLGGHSHAHAHTASSAKIHDHFQQPLQQPPHSHGHEHKHGHDQ
ncbi:MAG TPA: urease accessory protein UreE [Burkholderiales bacterium]|nr:urease accessory protein UreE [Burkholderiales bacterium]